MMELARNTATDDSRMGSQRVYRAVMGISWGMGLSCERSRPWQTSGPSSTVAAKSPRFIKKEGIFKNRKGFQEVGPAVPGGPFASMISEERLLPPPSVGSLLLAFCVCGAVPERPSTPLSLLPP